MSRKFDGGRVEMRETAFGVSRVDRYRERVNHLTEATLTLSQRLLGLLLLGNVQHYIYRPYKFPSLIVDRTGMGHTGQPGAVRAFDYDLAPVVFLVVLNRQRHPALIVSHRRSVDRVKLKRAAESFLGLIQFWRTTPYFDRTLAKICTQPFGVAGVSARGQFLQKEAQPHLANLYLRSRVIHQPFLSVTKHLIAGRQKIPTVINAGA